MREKCPNTELFLVRVSCIRTEYHRPISVSSHIPKVLTNPLFKPCPVFLSQFLLGNPYGFRKGFGTLYCFIGKISKSILFASYVDINQFILV